MKRFISITLLLITFSHVTWADYEYGPAQFVTIWDDEEQLFVAKLHNDPSKYAAEYLGVYVKMGGSQLADIQIVGKEGFSKSLRISIFKLVDGSLFELCSKTGDNWVQLPITLQMKNGKKLTGICSCRGRTWKGDMVQRLFSMDPNYPQFHQACRISLTVDFSELHCKGEPDPESLEHETFIATMLTSSDIKNLELGKGNYKTKFDPFSTRATINAMLRAIADCTYETDIYFPANTNNTQNKKK